MLILVSPSKTLDFNTRLKTKTHTQPVFLKESRQLVSQLKQLTPAELSSLMNISDKLGTQNFLRFNEWKTPFNLDNARQALFAFKGDVYAGIEAESFTSQDLKFAQQHLRILSGLYGVLKPLDLVQAYRLEMGTRLKNSKGDNLYEFWGSKITDQINLDLQKSKSRHLINLSSNEYFQSLQVNSIDAKIITPVFKEYNKGKYKVLSFFVKRARGRMAAYIIRNRLKKPEAIKDFNLDGYKYSSTDSTATNWVFKRKNTG